jgi:hypothetical protein
MVNLILIAHVAMQLGFGEWRVHSSIVKFNGVLTAFEEFMIGLQVIVLRTITIYLNSLFESTESPVCA